MAALPAFGAVRGEAVEHTAGGTALKAYIAYDDAIRGKRPGVLRRHKTADERRVAAIGYSIG